MRNEQIMGNQQSMENEWSTGNEQIMANQQSMGNQQSKGCQQSCLYTMTPGAKDSAEQHLSGIQDTGEYLIFQKHVSPV